MLASERIRHGCTVVVGCQWGDEGKGKIVDVLAEDADIVARYQGGANAGHTVHVGDDEFILHQIPSGILRGKRCLLGNGVVLDPVQFFEEHDALASRGVTLDGLIGVSDRAHLLLPFHKLLDRSRESESAAEARIGTTGRGIGPAYEDKAARRGARVVDLRSPDRLRTSVEARVAAVVESRQVPQEEVSELLEQVERALEVSNRLLELTTDTGSEIWAALGRGERVLLEGAQGTVLDIDHGTYPFVTSSTTTAGGAAPGVGVGPTAIAQVVGVVKAYTTRVGNGPLPTAFAADMDEHIRQLGGEFGATTGRPRRCGWFDAVVGRLAARVNGLTGLAVTKLDVLDTLPEIRLAVRYRTPDGEIEGFPADTAALDRAQPVYETHAGWQASTCDARSLAELPANARRYLDRIQELLEVPITMVSVGTRRSQIIQV